MVCDHGKYYCIDSNTLLHYQYLLSVVITATDSVHLARSNSGTSAALEHGIGAVLMPPTTADHGTQRRSYWVPLG
jgi:hypothetical protein